jgi:DNA-binding MarR family transcriptional regulator
MQFLHNLNAFPAMAVISVGNYASGIRSLLPGQIMPESYFSQGPLAPDTCLPFLIARARNGALRMLEGELASLNITAQQGMILLQLADGQHNTPGALARLAGVDSGAMTRLLDRLEAKQLVLRKADPSDRRAVRLVLSEQAAALMPSIADAVRSVHTRLWDTIPAPDAQRFHRSLLDLIGQSGQSGAPLRETP